MSENIAYFNSSDLEYRVDNGFKVTSGGALAFSRMQYNKPHSECYAIDITRKGDIDLLLNEVKQRILKGEKNFKIIIAQRDLQHWSSALLQVDENQKVKIIQFDSTAETDYQSILYRTEQYFPEALRFGHKL